MTDDHLMYTPARYPLRFDLHSIIRFERDHKIHVNTVCIRDNLGEEIALTCLETKPQITDFTHRNSCSVLLMAGGITNSRLSRGLPRDLIFMSHRSFLRV